MFRRTLFLLTFLISAITAVHAQHIALKNNILVDAMTAPNLSVEATISRHFSIDISGEYCGWDFNDTKSLKHWTARPEFRYWLNKSMDGWFAGLHGIYSDINYSGLDMLYGMKKGYAYDGYNYGGGLTLGYQFYLSPHWNLELSAGAGYLHFDYDKHYAGTGGLVGHYTRDYYGPTCAAISFCYIIN